MNDLKQNVETLAQETGKPELEIISELQTAAAETENSQLLDQLCELKWDYIEDEDPMFNADRAALISGDGWTVANV